MKIKFFSFHGNFYLPLRYIMTLHFDSFIKMLTFHRNLSYLNVNYITHTNNSVCEYYDKSFIVLSSQCWLSRFIRSMVSWTKGKIYPSNLSGLKITQNHKLSETGLSWGNMSHITVKKVCLSKKFYYSFTETLNFIYNLVEWKVRTD